MDPAPLTTICCQRRDRTMAKQPTPITPGPRQPTPPPEPTPPPTHKPEPVGPLTTDDLPPH